MRGERLSKNGEKAVELLINAGMSKNIAKTLIFLARNEEATSMEIERGTNLRQPEVSLTMQSLRRKKWIEKRGIKKEGKGRPIYCYKLIRPMKEIFKSIEDDALKKSKEIQRNLAELKKELRGL